MKKIYFFLLILGVNISFAQESELDKFYKHLDQYERYAVDSSYVGFKELEKTISKEDTLYNYALFYATVAGTELEGKYRMNEKFETSLKYANEALEYIEKGKYIFDLRFSKRKYFMTKNKTVNHFGMGNFEEGAKSIQKMYEYKKEDLLPEGLDEYFNFDFFVLDDKNVWGYEWFHELPKDRFSSSFTKIVYYVYSRNPDGTDKEQLYRLHVLMFHGDVDFDYVMTKRVSTENGETGGTLYKYTYNEKMDYEKLHNDVKEIIMSGAKTDTKTTLEKDKDGKVKTTIQMKM
ncbi:hypothetical protein [Aureivirga sp. CE67]|uniref:hypothetical protein n=1 Tax=Aureivirga sp. CE67 TaxID=1788983 RepID=UPI0018CBE6EC|nr:hypothetical protein [Aureivirga sp. CE67]